MYTLLHYGIIDLQSHRIFVDSDSRLSLYEILDRNRVGGVMHSHRATSKNPLLGISSESS